MNYKLINQRNEDFSPLDQVLYNRGIPVEELDHYYNTNYLDILDPLLLNNMREGAKMLIAHIGNNDKIYVQVDADCDGYTSSAVLINYLYRLFPNYVENNLTWGLHRAKEHGIDMEFVPSDVKLIVVPDASSNEYDLHKQLSEQGIDILILDHHEADQVSPYACVINNQLDNYPNKTLSGVGIVYKFCSYLDHLLNKNIIDDYADLVATGLTGDMIDVRTFETRELIRRGFARIRNPYLQGMVDRDQFHFSGEITQHKVAFYIVPLINAVTRVGSLEDKQVLFESMLEYRANALIPSTKRGEKGKSERIVTQAVRMCNNVKRAQTTERDNNLSKVKQLIEQNNLLDHKLLAVRLNIEDAANKNLTGLIANEIANEYQRPTLILNEIIDEEGNTHFAGSGRNFANSPIKNLKDELFATGLTDYAQGHQGAFGFSILAENFENFMQATDRLFARIDLTPTYLVDFIYSANENNYMAEILDLAGRDDLWGQSLAEPLVVIENVKINKDNITLMSKDKNPTLKIVTPSGLNIIKFKSNEEEFNKLFTDVGYIEINVIGTCALNEWMGNITAQLLVEDYEIIGRKSYYF